MDDEEMWEALDECRDRCFQLFVLVVGTLSFALTRIARRVADKDPLGRLSLRRFTRLTNAFSEKWENHAAMVALYFM